LNLPHPSNPYSFFGLGAALQRVQSIHCPGPGRTRVQRAAGKPLPRSAGAQPRRHPRPPGAVGGLGQCERIGTPITCRPL